MHAKYDSTPMRSFTQPWNLRRILGSQSVGCASSPSWPEAGITTRIIPAQSSRWTFRRPSNADLPTCRPADLPTCRPADLPFLVVGDHWGAARAFSSGHSAGVSWASPCPSQLFTSPSNCPKACSGISSRHYPSSVKPPSLIGNSEDPGTLPWKAPEFVHDHLPVARLRIVFHS